MTTSQNRIPPALLLNADYRPLSYNPLSVLSWQDAVRHVFQEKVDVVESWDVMLHAPSFAMPAPAVVALRDYVRPATRPAAFTRFNVYLRDGFACQYCGSPEDLTFDHVVPVSRGGRTSFENVVAACATCNSRKGALTPREAGLALRQQPCTPSVADLMEKGRLHPPPNLFREWADYCYWNVKIEE